MTNAEHAKCDSLIHFGEACLSAPSSRIPVLYIFGQQPVDIEHFSESLNDHLRETPLPDRSDFLLLYDSNISTSGRKS